MSEPRLDTVEINDTVVIECRNCHHSLLRTPGWVWNQHAGEMLLQIANEHRECLSMTFSYGGDVHLAIRVEAPR